MENDKKIEEQENYPEEFPEEPSETDLPSEEDELAEDPGGVVIENFDDDKDSDDDFGFDEDSVYEDTDYSDDEI